MLSEGRGIKSFVNSENDLLVGNIKILKLRYMCMISWTLIHQFIHLFRPLTDLYLFPVYLSPDQDWGTLGKIGQSADVEEFFVVVKRYLDALNSARENMEDKIDLSTEEEGSLVMQLANPNELPNIGKSVKVDQLHCYYWVRS